MYSGHNKSSVLFWLFYKSIKKYMPGTPKMEADLKKMCIVRFHCIETNNVKTEFGN